MKFEQLLARNVRGFWATTYSFGLKLFDQYLLRKLSQNTLNALIAPSSRRLLVALDSLILFLNRLFQPYNCLSGWEVLVSGQRWDGSCSVL